MSDEIILPREIRLTSTFKKHIKDKEKLFHARFIEAIYFLMNDKPLPESYCDHQLTHSNFRECHIQPDWLLIYQKIENNLVLVFLTNYNDLTKMLNKMK